MSNEKLLARAFELADESPATAAEIAALEAEVQKILAEFAAEAGTSFILVCSDLILAQQNASEHPLFALFQETHARFRVAQAALVEARGW